MSKCNPEEFTKFYDTLMSNAPKDYVPWLFPVVANNKYPDALGVWKLSKETCLKCNVKWEKLPKGKQKIWLCPKCGAARSGWKEPHARMTKEQCIQRLKEGGNIGISAREKDCLVIIDRDEENAEEIKKPTLTTTSRSRIGGHYFGIAGDKKIKTNIPTAEGEVRSKDQYVVAPGSFVEVSKEDLKLLSKTQQKLAGQYTINTNLTPATIKFKDLPQIYKDNYVKEKQNIPLQENTFTKKSFGKYSSIYDLKMSDIVTQIKPRDPHPIHNAKKTDGNFSLSPGGEIAHCWRCMVSLNAIQYLAVKSGEYDCRSAGTPHKGQSKKLDNKLIFYAWRQAKLDGYISIADPIPIKALHYIALKHKLISCDWDILPNHAYYDAIKIVEDEY